MISEHVDIPKTALNWLVQQLPIAVKSQQHRGPAYLLRQPAHFELRAGTASLLLVLAPTKLKLAQVQLYMLQSHQRLQ